LEDAQQIKKLLLSGKEESELTMCTDVDRNDKSRICVPGSVKVLGRRQIEMYSRLIHTVDHVEGYLRQGFDALDAFMCHTWAVTVTGAPKTWAIRFLEDNEKSPRYWYGGAVGIVGFDGTLNTGLTLRTIRVQNGVAEVRAGATLLHDSDPDAEEAETELKASALLDAINRASNSEVEIVEAILPEKSIEIVQKNVLLVDHEDSFVHTLANYLRQTGAEVKVVRSGNAFMDFVSKEIDSKSFVPDLVVLSPGPGSPSDFKLSTTINEMMKRNIPIFGVCLGLQGLVEHFGGDLDVLGYPMHGKPSQINRVLDAVVGDCTVENSNIDILNGLPAEFQVARYHSLHARLSTFPKELAITAVSKDGIVMAIQHKTMPIAAVQFHPESILTLPKYGMKILTNALELLKSDGYKF
jgi:anthranilate synthase